MSFQCDSIEVETVLPFHTFSLLFSLQCPKDCWIKQSFRFGLLYVATQHWVVLGLPSTAFHTLDLVLQQSLGRKVLMGLDRWHLLRLSTTLPVKESSACSQFCQTDWKAFVSVPYSTERCVYRSQSRLQQSQKRSIFIAFSLFGMAWQTSVSSWLTRNTVRFIAYLNIYIAHLPKVQNETEYNLISQFRHLCISQWQKHFFLKNED